MGRMQIRLLHLVQSPICRVGCGYFLFYKCVWSIHLLVWMAGTWVGLVHKGVRRCTHTTVRWHRTLGSDQVGLESIWYRLPWICLSVSEIWKIKRSFIFYLQIIYMYQDLHFLGLMYLFEKLFYVNIFTMSWEMLNPWPLIHDHFCSLKYILHKFLDFILVCSLFTYSRWSKINFVDIQVNL